VAAARRLQACLQARRWQDQFPDAPPLSMHVNLSGRQLEEQRLVGEVVQALETARLSPRLLTLEITEGVLVSDIEAMSARLRELKGLGVHLAIDDFGTGYSSLSSLRGFPIDMLKIDKAFVDGSAGAGRTPPWPMPSSSSATPCSWTPWPRGSRRPSRRPAWSPWAAGTGRATTSRAR